MSRLIGFILSESGAVVAILAVLVAVLASASRLRARLALRSVIFVGCFYLAVSVYAVPSLISRILSVRYEPFSASDVGPGRTAVVLLAGGVQTAHGSGDRRLSVLNLVSASRVVEAARVYELIAPQWIISSGGPGSAPGAEPGGIVMRDALVQLGVPSQRILVEARSTTTHVEAVLIAPMLRSLGAQRVVVVTSAAHMPRSLGAFRAEGWSAVPAVARDPHADDPWSDWLIPGRNGILLTSDVAHEIVGLPYYWLRGWWKP
jgi:uncharacterized SAM-binding protein YcdF (DUF218 family)